MLQFKHPSRGEVDRMIKHINAGGLFNQRCDGRGASFFRSFDQD
jgi:hypothetical protein